MLRALAPVLCLLALTGCEPDRSLGSDARSGSRLRIRFWVAPGGAEVEADWYDTLLEVPCIPREASDGTLRCLPVSPFSVSAFILGGTPTHSGLYEDAACSQPLIPWSGSCDAPARHHQYERDACGAGWAEVYDVTGEVSPSQLFSIELATGDCVPRDSGLFGSQFLRLGPERPPSDFVRLAPPSPEGQGRLRHRHYAGEDGAQIPADIYDSQLDTPCRRWWDARGEHRCLPYGAHISGFADDQCQTPVTMVVQPDVSCALPEFRFGATAEVVGCTERKRIYPLGEPTTDASPYTLTIEGLCEPSAPPSAEGIPHYWMAGAELSPEDLVAVSELPPQGGGRIRMIIHQDDEGFVVLSWLWDEALQTHCWPTLMADTTQRCAPSRMGSVRDTYADDQCTTPRPSVELYWEPCPETPLPLYAGAGTESCPPETRVYEVGAALDGAPLYELDSGGGCREALQPGDYALGAEILPSELVKMTLEQR